MSRSASPVRSGDESRGRHRSRSDSPKRKRVSDDERPSRKEPGIRVRPDIKHVFVGPTGQRMGNNIKYYCTEKELEEKFSEYGEVANVKVRSNTKDVFAFIHFNDSESAARAIENMNGKQLQGVKVKVDWGSNNSNRSAPRRLPPSVRRRSPGGYRDSHRSDRYERRAPSPRGYRRSPERRYERSERRRSPSPRYERRRSPPPRRRSPSPRYRRSPEPRYRRSPSPRYRRSPSPRYR